MKFGAKKKAIEFATSAAVEYKQLLRNYLRRRLRKPDDLDDLAQEVYLRLLRIQDETQINRVREPMAYVYAVAANVVADWNRAADRSVELGVSIEAIEGEGPALEEEETPYKTWNGCLVDRIAPAERIDRQQRMLDDDPAERAARQQHIERVFAQLPPIQAAALLLHARDGLSYQEIAKQLNLSYEMVHYHIRLAKARVRLTPWER